MSSDASLSYAASLPPPRTAFTTFLDKFGFIGFIKNSQNNSGFYASIHEILFKYLSEIFQILSILYRQHFIGYYRGTHYKAGNTAVQLMVKCNILYCHATFQFCSINSQDKASCILCNNHFVKLEK